MSVQTDKSSKNIFVTIGSEEPMIRWADDIDLEVDDEISITSEEETGSDYDGEQRARTKPVQEIWDINQLWNDLQELQDAEEVHDILLNENLEQLLRKDNKTALLLSAWLGKFMALKLLLDNNVPVYTTDNNGRTATHLAAYAGKVDCLKLLIDRGASITSWDNKRQATPLHCAASMGHLSCLKLLIRHGVDVNAGLSNRSPLHYAVQNLAVDCVKELLEHNASPNTPQIFSETPLHIAASLGASEIVKLLLEYGAAANVQCGTEKLTPLHLAAEDGDAESTRLLLDSGALIKACNHKNQTPLHLAALSQCSETLELLLSKGADPNASDTDGRTPLHSAIVKVSRSCECVRLLLDAGANVNKPDAFGYTPMHLAALNEFSHCLILLLNYGGDVTARTNGGISVLTFITRKTPDVIPKYIAKFDNSIKLNDHDIGDVDCELKLDFRILIPTRGNRETELLLNFIEVGHKEVLKHPLCETFLFLKWRRIRKFFLFSLFYHSLFVFLYTFYIIGVYLKNCRIEHVAINCYVPDYIVFMGYALLCLNMMLLGKELFQIAHSWLAYLKQWENWLQWLIIITVFCCVQPIRNMNITKDVRVWQHYVAAIGIFFAWAELMMIVGRFPIFGLYIQMFAIVSINFTKFILAYFCLFVAFALSFGVIFANYKTYKDIKWVIVKVIIMMSGELEDDNVFFDDDYPVLCILMYLAFVLLITVILTNLMVGLAVNDIQGLQQSAGLDRLVRQAELVAHLESMLFSRLLTCIPPKLMKFLHKQALLLKSQYHWALYIKPNDPREERIPKELIKSIYQLVTERKDKPRSRRRKKFTSSNSDFISPTISRMNSYYSGLTCNDNLKVTNNLKIQIDEINKEFVDYCKIFRQKLDKISNQIGNIQR